MVVLAFRLSAASAKACTRCCPEVAFGLMDTLMRAWLLMYMETVLKLVPGVVQISQHARRPPTAFPSKELYALSRVPDTT